MAGRHVVTLSPHQSVLQERAEPGIRQIKDLFRRIRVYRDWEFGATARVRDPASADLSSDFVTDDGANLALVLSDLLTRPGVNQELRSKIALFYEDFLDLHPHVAHNQVAIRLEEKHLNDSVPLSRLSDGTLRWLTLMCVLLHPQPPAVVCIEEPELGLHPDMIHEIGKLLVEASKRMQLIVTTHSPELIEQFQETPEAVVICEKHDGITHFQRLKSADLAEWLKEYSLGQLWRRGHFWGNRW